MAKKTTLALKPSVAWTISAAALLVLVPPAPAQPGTLQRPPLAERPAPEKRRLLDGVIGIFGDKAILESSIRSELQAQIEGARNAGRRMTDAEIMRMRNDILRTMLQDEALAQGARTMRGTSRQQVDQMVNQYVREFRREEEERAGSVNQLTQDLGILGQTWESLAEERRTEMMASMARTENLRRRYQDSFSLAVTPAEMRTFYQTNTVLFVQQRSANLEVLAFAGGGPEVLERAEQAAASWRTEPRDAKEVAKAFGGVALNPREGVRPTRDDPHAPPIKEFVAKAGEGDVSDPIQRGNSFWILRARGVNQGRHDTFADPKVQAYIHRRLVNARIEADNQKLILRERDKLRIISTKPNPR